MKIISSWCFFYAVFTSVCFGFYFFLTITFFIRFTLHVTGNVSWVFDFGQNMAGTTTLTLPPQPTALTLAARHAERLDHFQSFVANSYCGNSGTLPVEGSSCMSCGSYPGPNITTFGGNCANQVR